MSKRQSPFPLLSQQQKKPKKTTRIIDNIDGEVHHNRTIKTTSEAAATSKKRKRGENQQQTMVEKPAKQEKHTYYKMLDKVKKESKKVSLLMNECKKYDENDVTVTEMFVEKKKRGRKSSTKNLSLMDGFDPFYHPRGGRNNNIHEQYDDDDDDSDNNNNYEEEEDEERPLKKAKFNDPIPIPALLQNLIRAKHPFLFHANPSSIAKDYFNHSEHSKIINLEGGCGGGGGGGDHSVHTSYGDIKPLITLHDYQEETLKFIDRRENDVEQIRCKGLMLCHDMGLGKTPISLVRILLDNQEKFRKTGERFSCRTLVVLKNILVDTWLTELKKHFPAHTFVYYDLTDPSQLDSIDLIHLEKCCDIVFITYSMLSTTYKIMTTPKDSSFNNNNNKHILEEDEEDDDENEYDDDEEEEEKNISLLRRQKTIEKHEKLKMLFKVRWTRVITDESQQFVNKKTKLFTAVNSLIADSKWVVSGTPIQNSLDNIYACFEFIGIPESMYSEMFSNNCQSISPVLQQSLTKKNNRDRNYDEIQESRIIQKILDIVMIRLVKSDSLLKKNNILSFKGVDREVVYINFESEQEKLIYLLYSAYGLRNLQQMRQRKRCSTSANTMTTTQKSGRDYHNRVTYIIQLMRQLCINLRIVKNLVLPKGMLTMNLKKELMLKKPNDEEEEENLFPSIEVDKDEEQDGEESLPVYSSTSVDNDELSQFVNTIKPTPYESMLFEYESALSDTKETINWDPYRSMQNFNDEDKDEYKTIYKHMKDLPTNSTTKEQEYRIVDTMIQAYIEKKKKMPCSALQKPFIMTTNISVQLRKKYLAMIDHLKQRRLSYGSTKDIHIINYIKNIEDPTDKVIIFSDYVKGLSCLGTQLSKEGFKCAIVTGDRVKNSSNIDQLQLFKDDPTVRILLLSLKLGNNGLNLSCANHILFYSIWWNPHPELQAEDRSIRIGQEKIVHVRRFVILGTIEEYMLKLSNEKKKISETLIKPINQPSSFMKELEAAMADSQVNEMEEEEVAQQEEEIEDDVTNEVSSFINENIEKRLINKYKDQLFNFNITISPYSLFTV
jgi:SNF2 family DNA or RNA helicase